MINRTIHSGSRRQDEFLSAGNKKLKIAVSQVFIGIDDYNLTLLPADYPAALQRFQKLYTNACLEESDILCFPEYCNPLAETLQQLQIKEEAPFVMIYGSHLCTLRPFLRNKAEDKSAVTGKPENAKFKMGIQKSHFSEAEKSAGACSSQIHSIFNTELGDFGISAGTDFLFDNFANERIDGLFIVSHSPAVLSYINAIHKLFAVNRELQFIVFTNPATNLPVNFPYPRKQTYGIVTGKNSNFWNYYEPKTDIEDMHYVLKEKLNLQATYEYLSRYMYTYGHSGLFCRQQNLDPYIIGAGSRQNRHYIEYDLTGEQKKYMRIYDTIQQRETPGGNIVHLTCHNKLFTDYLLIFQYNAESKHIVFDQSIEIDAITPGKFLNLAKERRFTGNERRFI